MLGQKSLIGNKQPASIMDNTINFTNILHQIHSNSIVTSIS